MSFGKGTLPYVVEELIEIVSKEGVEAEHLWYVIRNAIDPKLLVSNIAEALRISSSETESILVEKGFGDLVGQAKAEANKDKTVSGSTKEYQINPLNKTQPPYEKILSFEFSPPLDHQINITPSFYEIISLIKHNLIESIPDDTFLALYRNDVKSYYHSFMENEAKTIDEYLSNNFKNASPRYIVNSGIGANEQFNHFVASINNSDPDRHLDWLIIDSPRHLDKLPQDASIENTLFMEFSRSGKTEETVKIHEYTPRNAKRIVFANSGPLKDIGNRDGNLVLDLPDQVSGRFGRNKTPILLAPMYVARMDTEGFWNDIEKAINAFDLTSHDNLPLQIAQFIYMYQKINNSNHIYLGCNDDLLASSADELLQFWNEGVNKDGNDISMSRYFGLLRDSHLNIEGLLANHKTKLGIFLLRDNMCPKTLPPLVSRKIDPINLDHEGLIFGEEEKILAEANYQRFSELMPTIKITVNGSPSLSHAAVLGQLWSDITFCYSRMMNVDPGSNPEVKYVRDRAAMLLGRTKKK